MKTVRMSKNVIGVLNGLRRFAPLCTALLLTATFGCKSGNSKMGDDLTDSSSLTASRYSNPSGYPDTGECIDYRFGGLPKETVNKISCDNSCPGGWTGPLGDKCYEKCEDMRDDGLLCNDKGISHPKRSCNITSKSETLCKAELKKQKDLWMTEEYNCKIACYYQPPGRIAIRTTPWFQIGASGDHRCNTSYLLTPSEFLNLSYQCQFDKSSGNVTWVECTDNNRDCKDKSHPPVKRTAP